MESTFGATAIERDGRRMLQVEGTCACPTAGYSLALELDDPGVVPHPEDVVLRLVERGPDVGGEVITGTPVSYGAEIGRGASRVVIRVPEAEPLSIPIEDGSPAAEPRRPNSFQLSGEGDVELTYEETSITGESRFTYRDTSREISRMGAQIRREEASIGTLVTIELEAVPDLQVVELTLLIPSISLRNGDADFETLVIETTSKTSVGGPGMISGPLQSYRVRTLRGTARFREGLGRGALREAWMTSTPTPASKGETMNGNNRGNVWNPEIWAEIDDAVRNTIGQVRVAQKVFAATSLPGAAVVPDDQIDVGELTVPEGRTKPLLEISGEFPLTQSQTANESSLKTGKALARITATAIGRVEDELIFVGKNARVPTKFDVLNKESADSGLLGAAPTTIPVDKADPTYPDLIFKKVVEGISRLTADGQPGPYALFLESEIFADAHTPNGASVTPADRIKPLVTGGFYPTGTLLIPGARGAADRQMGLLVSLGGEPTAIYVGQDASTEITQSDVKGNLRFRVFERVQFVPRDRRALVAFEFS